ncbi:MAG: hypothetical protein EXR73_14385 [Myxococcales bacterium]|nr:hypothetical protein [Myxococcales bacterium]
MKARTVALIAAVVVLRGAIGGADPTVAKKHYDDGMAHYVLHDWDEAIRAFKAGFVEAHLPAFLYNIGQSYRMSNRPTEAVEFFRRFLELSTDPKGRAEVEALIKKTDAARPTAPPAAVAPPPAAVPAKPEAVAPAVATPPSSAVPAAALVPAVAETKPLTRRGWFWGVVGGAAALVAAGVIVGVLVGGGTSDPMPSRGTITIGGM